MLTPGEKLGPYEVCERIGAGGMGEVWLARDPRLQRDVAIKVLPKDLSQDPERLARLEREARLLASLDHPNVAAVHGLEEAGEVRFLVMQLAEGETLADRLLAGPLPLDETLEVALQIARGLEAAHERGVVHRDLKPANVMVAPDGAVKILDFGLAKALAADDETAASAPDITASPTILAATRAGVILGTAGYMSPEQARGKPLDKRTDVWAFGCVLYELLTGRSTFSGETVSDVVAAVLTANVDFEALPDGLSPRLGSLLERCLERDPRRRLRDIGEARIVLEDMVEQGGLASPRDQQAAPPGPAAATSRWAWPIAAAAIIVAALSIVWPREQEPVPTPLMRFALAPAPEREISSQAASPVLLSPQGDRLVTLVEVGNKRFLQQRLLSEDIDTTVAGSEGALDPFFSPDGESLGFFADGYLKQVSLSGGLPEIVARAGNDRGGAWSPEDTMLFTPNTDDALFQVDAGGGDAETISTLDTAAGERSHRFPDVLPGGDFAFFSIAYETGNPLDDASIALLDLATGRHEVLIRNAAYPRYSGDGYLLYVQGRDLFAVPFDAASRTLGGPARLVQEGVRASSTNGGASYAVSRGGDLVYLEETQGDVRVPLVWLDRDGNEELLPVEERDYSMVRLAAQTSLIFAEVGDPAAAVWVYDMERETLAPLTTAGVAYGPVPSPDGQRVAFEAVRDGSAGIWTIAVNGTDERRLTSTTGSNIPTSWAGDGSAIAYTDLSRDRPLEVWVVDPDDADSTRVLLQGDHNVGGAAFSPDSRWIAYVSDESGRFEVYVRPYPDLGARYPISNGGGRAPRWAPDGSELFFVSDEGIMGVDIRLDTVVSIGRPRLVVESFFPRSASGLAYDQSAHYDVSPDGRRFLMPRFARDAGPPPTPILVLGFSSVLGDEGGGR